jgi:uncharacterized short protein YbdD (DUF466 family)
MPAIAMRAEVKVRTGLGPPVRPHWFRRAARIAWRGLREWCGDSAYELYLRSNARQSSDSRILSPAEFYVEQLNRRYSCPNRCC